MEHNNLPSFLFTAILALILLVPYLSRVLYIEPFPAVIMPVGHGKIKKSDNKISNLEYEITIFSEGDSISTSIDQLFPKIPEQYYIPILHNNLGFTFSEKAETLQRSFNYKKGKDKNSYKESKELVDYYESILSSPLDSIKLKATLVERAIDQGNIKSKSKFFEEIFKVD